MSKQFISLIVSSNVETAVRIIKENPQVENLSINGPDITVSFNGVEEDEAGLLKDHQHKNLLCHLNLQGP